MFPIRDTISPKHRPLMTWVILIMNALVFLLQLSMGQETLTRFAETFSLVPARLFSDPAWYVLTLFTHMFMHGGWFHFLSNMWMLFIFGDNVEDRMGPIAFLFFYILGGLAAAGMQTLVSPLSTIPALGASGAIAGVMGAYLLMYPRAKVVTWVPLFIFGWIMDVSALFFLGFWFISQVFSGLSGVSGVAWWAHIGGFLFGLILGPIFYWRPKPKPPRQADVVYAPPPRRDVDHW